MLSREATQTFTVRCVTQRSGIQIDVYEAAAIDASMNLEQRVVRLVEAFDSVEMRCLVMGFKRTVPSCGHWQEQYLEKITFAIVRPAVVSTTKHKG
jgi:hypothetical protein